LRTGKTEFDPVSVITDQCFESVGRKQPQAICHPDHLVNVETCRNGVTMFPKNSGGPKAWAADVLGRD